MTENFTNLFLEKLYNFDKEFCDKYFYGEKGKEIINKFEILKDGLIEWNKKINLTSIVDEEGIIIKHFIDSISVINCMQKISGSMVDVGTGAGFPGIPVKIILGDLKICLLDSTAKKLKFSEYIVDKLSLKNISTLWGRAEETGHKPDFRESWDICTARAVAPVNVLLEYCLPLLKVGGALYIMKGPAEKKEAPFENAIKKLGGKLIEIKNFFLQGSEHERNIIIINKIEKCDSIYPRKSGIPSKNPI